MKNLVAKLLILVVVVAGFAGSASANARNRKFEVQLESKGQYLMEFPDFHRKWEDVKILLEILSESLMPSDDIDGPGGGGGNDSKSAADAKRY